MDEDGMKINKKNLFSPSPSAGASSLGMALTAEKGQACILNRAEENKDV